MPNIPWFQHKEFADAMDCVTNLKARAISKHDLSNKGRPVSQIARRPCWDAMTLLLLSFIKVAMGTMAFFIYITSVAGNQYFVKLFFGGVGGGGDFPGSVILPVWQVHMVIRPCFQGLATGLIAPSIKNWIGPRLNYSASNSYDDAPLFSGACYRTDCTYGLA